MNREEVEEVEVEEEEKKRTREKKKTTTMAKKTALKKRRIEERNRRHSSNRCPVRLFVVCRLARQLAGVNRRNYIEEKLPRDNSD